MPRASALSPQEVYNLLQRATFAYRTGSHVKQPPVVLLDVRDISDYNVAHIISGKPYGPGSNKERTDLENFTVVLYGDRESYTRVQDTAAEVLKMKIAATVHVLAASFEEFFDNYPYMIQQGELSDDEGEISEDDDFQEDSDNEEGEYEENPTKRTFFGKKRREPQRVTFPTEILERRLYLSDGVQAKNPKVVWPMGITHIVNVTTHIENSFENEGIKYHRIAVHDSSVAVIEDHFEKSYKFIKKAMEENTTNRVLVHCSQGVSRSATIVIYFLMREKKMKMMAARKAVEECRPWIWPNEGFVRQLGRAEEGALNGKGAGKKSACVIQ